MKKNNSEKNIVEVTRKKVTGGPTSITIKKRAHKILQALGCENCELSIVLCDDNFIHQLNKEYRNKDKPTDVLSFPMNDNPQNPPANALLGDVIISIDTAQEQASQRNHLLLTEVSALLVHGILHLLGHTHETDADEKSMNEQAATLTALF